ncbi:MAG TPA: hypothetical protein DCG47_09365 [Spirochaetaceae bacterium]|nr:hypothetical protein [Spirochaetaceae bacterium]
MRPRIGFLVPPPDWSALIVGVYEKAISLLHADGALVSLVRGAEDMEARAIALDESWDIFAWKAKQAFEEAGYKRQAYVDFRLPGSSGVNQAPCITLRIGEGYGGAEPSHGAQGFSLALDDAEPWDTRDELRQGCRAALPADGGLAAAIAASLAMLKAFLAQTIPESSDGIGGGGSFGKAFTRLKERQDFPACLVGFGPGTTPAGDDWLAGFLAAAELGGPLNRLAGLQADIRQRLPSTGAAGRALLLGAIAGAPPAYLSRVRQACLRCAADGGSALSLAIEAALGHGASSGRDSLEGFQAGLESIQDFSPRD